MRLTCIYGPHQSSCHGLSLGLDPLLPPKRCPLDCALCPLSTPPKFARPLAACRLEDELSENSQALEAVQALYVWGSGDPLSSPALEEALAKAREALEGLARRPRLVLRTPMLLAGRLSGQLAGELDEVVVPLFGGVLEWSSMHRPPRGFDQALYRAALKKWNSEHGKLKFKVVLARTTGGGNYDDESLRDLVAFVRGIAEEIYLDTINRPVADRGARPVSQGVLKRAAELFESEGIRARICQPQRAPVRLRLTRLEERLWNHALRKPISTEEVMEIYGDMGPLALNNLRERGLVEQRPWEGKLFFFSLPAPRAPRQV
ncbi:MAG: hypothetical protein ABWK00_02120 [Desulfurococcaceae archaeon]